MQEATSQRRIIYLDYLRIISMLSVITIHVATNNWYGYIETARWEVLTYYSAIARFSVPAFLMISGALFLDDNRRLSIKKLYTKNVLKLVVVLVFWGVCYQIYNLRFDFSTNNIKTVILNIIIGNTQIHFWFIYTIMGIYIILPIIKIFAENADKQTVTYILLLFFVFVILKNTLSCFDWRWGKIIINNLNRYDISEMGYLGYFVLGHYFNKCEIKKRTRHFIYFIGTISIIVSIYLTISESRRQTFPVECFMNYLSIFIFFWSSAIFLVIKNNCTNRESRIIQKIADASLGIYIIHMFIVFEFWRYGFTTFSFNSVLSVPAITILVFLISYMLVTIISKIPIIGRWII